MKVAAQHRYAHDVATVYAGFVDREEIKAKQKALGARKIRVTQCDTTVDGAEVRFDRELPASVPDILRRFIQPWNRVQQAEKWRRTEDGFAAQLTIDIAGVPVDVAGTLRLKPAKGGCVNQVRIEVSCGIPFVGKTLAEFIAADCERLVAEEYDYISARLDG